VGRPGWDIAAGCALPPRHHGQPDPVGKKVTGAIARHIRLCCLIYRVPDAVGGGKCSGLGAMGASLPRQVRASIRAWRLLLEEFWACTETGDGLGAACVRLPSCIDAKCVSSCERHTEWGGCLRGPCRQHGTLPVAPTSRPSCVGALCLHEPVPHLTVRLWCVDGDVRSIT
jgi:hypothetical protein